MTETPLRSRLALAIAIVALLVGVLWLGAQRDSSAPCVRDGKVYSQGAYLTVDNAAVVCHGGRWVVPSGAGS